MTPPAAPAAAGLWPRALAFAGDYLFLALYLGALAGLSWAAQALAPGLLAALFGSALAGQLTGLVVITLPVTLYFALPEASARQATWGKRRVGLRVQRADGARLSRGRSLARTALKFVPWELAHFTIWQLAFAADPEAPVYLAGFGLVWALIGANVVSVLVSPRRRALYGWLAGTVVVRQP